MLKSTLITTLDGGNYVLWYFFTFFYGYSVLAYFYFSGNKTVEKSI
jgi:hypothetical protein